MKKYVFICFLCLTLGYASNTKDEAIVLLENEVIQNDENTGLSFNEFLNVPLEKLY